jgi:hypothetical protein
MGPIAICQSIDTRRLSLLSDRVDSTHPPIATIIREAEVEWPRHPGRPTSWLIAPTGLMYASKRAGRNRATTDAARLPARPSGHPRPRNPLVEASPSAEVILFR